MAGARPGRSAIPGVWVLGKGGRAPADVPDIAQAAAQPRRERAGPGGGRRQRRAGLPLFQEVEYGAGSHLVSGHHLADGPVPAVWVSVETLDHLVSSRGLERLDVVEIDAEEFEPDVLAGGAGAVECFRSVVYMGFNFWTLIAHRNLNPREFLEGLARRFPRVLAFGPEGELEPVSGRHGRLGFLLRGCVDDPVLCHDVGWADGLAAD